MPAFLEALHRELDLRADALLARFGPTPPLNSVYLGGGTPSLLAPAAVGELLDHVARRLGIAPDAEITLEANPGPDERGDLEGIRAAGVTRLSVGAQSLHDAELRRLGRRHRPADVAETVRFARRAGIGSVSLDLLTDIPTQTVESWRTTLEAALTLAPDHLSVYALTLDDPDAEALTGQDGDHLPLRPGARRWRERAREDQDEDRAADLDALTDALLSPIGFRRYELSNHALPGHESRHNLVYWHRLAYEALGPGAHAFDGAFERRWTAARLDRYLAALVPPGGARPALPPGGHEILDERTAWAEAVILALRTDGGIAALVLADPSAGPALTWALEHGLADRAGERLRLTPRGRQLSNEVFARLLPERPGGGD
jgi:oxygen-independent coproporphyrinogen-3 oxidase